MFEIQAGGSTPLCATLPCNARCIRGALENENSLLLWGPSSCWTLYKNAGCAGENALLSHPLARNYSAMCYDSAEKCFWAVAASQPNILYKLNERFEERSCTRIRTHCGHTITGISCDEGGRGIWIICPARIGLLSKETCKIEWQIAADRTRSYCGILMHCGYQISAVSTPCGLVVRAISPRSEQSAEISVPQAYSLLGILPRAANAHGSCCFSLLFRELYADTVAVMHCCVVSEHCFSAPACDAATDARCMPSKCHPPHCPCPPRCPCPLHCHCKQGCYEIMHSIALEEAALAHMLNAEGEKLQKAVTLACSVEQLLDVNESVKQAITQASLLEGQLYSKLEAVLSHCKSCGSRHKHMLCNFEAQNRNTSG